VFESIPESVLGQAEAAVALLGGGDVSRELTPDFGGRPFGAESISVRIGHPPKALSAVLAALPPGSDVRASARVGIVEAALPPEQSRNGAAVERLRERLAAHQAHGVVYATPLALRGAVDHWGPVGPTLSLMQRVKDEYDPEHRFSPGRFVGGI
jgi:glycolate oxidase FAD binding subunit